MPRNVGRRLIPLIALALNLDATFFNKPGMMDEPLAFVRLLHYPGWTCLPFLCLFHRSDIFHMYHVTSCCWLGKSSSLERGIVGASAHSDYGMLTLLATDGVQGLQAGLRQIY